MFTLFRLLLHFHKVLEGKLENKKIGKSSEMRLCNVFKCFVNKLCFNAEMNRGKSYFLFKFVSTEKRRKRKNY